MSIEVADSFYYQGEFKRAIETYTKVLENDNSNSNAFEGRGLSYYGLLKIEEALDDLTQAVITDPENHNAFYNRGLIYLEKEELEKAKSDLEKALEIYGESIDYLSNCAYVNSLLKNNKHVVKYTKRLLDYSADDVFALERLAFAYMDLEDYDKALFNLNLLFKLNSQNAYLTCNNIGFCMIHQERYKEAIPYFNTSIKLKADFAFPYNNRGFCKFKLGHIEGGKADILKSLELVPSNSYAYRNLGILYMENNDKENAIKKLEKAIELGYTEDYGEDVQTLLNQIR